MPAWRLLGLPVDSAVKVTPTHPTCLLTNDRLKLSERQPSSALLSRASRPTKPKDVYLPLTSTKEDQTHHDNRLSNILVFFHGSEERMKDEGFPWHNMSTFKMESFLKHNTSQSPHSYTVNKRGLVPLPDELCLLGKAEFV